MNQLPTPLPTPDTVHPQTSLAIQGGAAGHPKRTLSAPCRPQHRLTRNEGYACRGGRVSNGEQPGSPVTSTHPTRDATPMQHCSFHLRWPDERRTLALPAVRRPEAEAEAHAREVACNALNIATTLCFPVHQQAREPRSLPSWPRLPKSQTSRARAPTPAIDVLGA